MGDVITVTNNQTLSGIVTDNGGLAVEVVDALYPQWSVNGHHIAEAFATVAERHTDPAIRETAATTPLAEILTAALEAVFWQRAREERQALRG